MTTTLELLAWIIGFGNPLAATLHGPALAVWLRRRGRPDLIDNAQGLAWAVLFLTQCTFLTFGILSALGGFRYAQALMIPVAALNFWVWWKHRPAVRMPVQELVDAIEAAEKAGAVTVTRFPAGAAEVFADGRSIGWARNIRVTPLDADGKPAGKSWSIGHAVDLENAEFVEARVYSNSGTGMEIAREQLEQSPVAAADRLTRISMEHAHENYRAHLRRWQTEVDTNREQCPTPIHDASMSAPERCALDLDHEGDHQP